LTEKQIDEALERVPAGLGKYLWLQERVWNCDVSTAQDFQTRFNGFYRVRRNEAWRVQFYALMETAKTKDAPFPEILGALHDATGRVEASFASKLVATLTPDKPVIDRYVLENFGLRLPYSYSRDRIRETVEVYRQLIRGYDNLLRSEMGTLICTKFEARFPGSP
jgi:hypothetical protein